MSSSFILLVLTVTLAGSAVSGQCEQGQSLPTGLWDLPPGSVLDATICISDPSILSGGINTATVVSDAEMLVIPNLDGDEAGGVVYLNGSSMTDLALQNSTYSTPQALLWNSRYFYTGSEYFLSDPSAGNGTGVVVQRDAVDQSVEVVFEYAAFNCGRTVAFSNTFMYVLCDGELGSSNGTLQSVIHAHRITFDNTLTIGAPLHRLETGHVSDPFTNQALAPVDVWFENGDGSHSCVMMGFPEEGLMEMWCTDDDDDDNDAIVWSRSPEGTLPGQAAECLPSFGIWSRETCAYTSWRSETGGSGEFDAIIVELVVLRFVMAAEDGVMMIETPQTLMYELERTVTLEEARNSTLSLLMIREDPAVMLNIGTRTVHWPIPVKDWDLFEETAVDLGGVGAVQTRPGDSEVLSLTCVPDGWCFVDTFCTRLECLYSYLHPLNGTIYSWSRVLNIGVNLSVTGGEVDSLTVSWTWLPILIGVLISASCLVLACWSKRVRSRASLLDS